MERVTRDDACARFILVVFLGLADVAEFEFAVAENCCGDEGAEAYLAELESMAAN